MKNLHFDHDIPFSGVDWVADATPVRSANRTDSSCGELGLRRPRRTVLPRSAVEAAASAAGLVIALHRKRLRCISGAAAGLNAVVPLEQLQRAVANFFVDRKVIIAWRTERIEHACR